MTRLATCILLIIVLIEAVALLGWVTYPFISTATYKEVLSQFTYAEEWMFNATLFLCPTLLIPTLYMWATKFLRRFSTKAMEMSIEHEGKVVRHTRWGAEEWGKLVDKLRVEGLSLPFQGHHRLVLAFAIASSVLIPLYPYHPSLNPEGNLVGVDVPHYLASLKDMTEEPQVNIFEYVFWQGIEGSRPLYLLILYLAKVSTRLADKVIIILQPTFLSSLLAVSVYFLVKEATRNDGLASFSALFTPLSYQTTVMMFGAFYANWLALAEIYISLGLLLRFSRESSWRALAGAALASTAALYTHPWTWGIFMAVLGCRLLAILIKREGTARLRILPLAFILAINLAADAVKGLLLGSLSGFEAGYEEVSARAGFSQLAAFWPNLTIALRDYLGGYLWNPVVLALAALGALSVFFVRKDFHRILGLWMILTSILLPLSNHAMQARLLFNLPFQILLTYGLAIITSQGRNTVTTKLLVLATILVNLNYTFRSLGNLLT